MRSADAMRLMCAPLGPRIHLPHLLCPFDFVEREAIYIHCENLPPFFQRPKFFGEPKRKKFATRLPAGFNAQRRPAGNGNVSPTFWIRDGGRNVPNILGSMEGWNTIFVSPPFTIVNCNCHPRLDCAQVISERTGRTTKDSLVAAGSGAVREYVQHQLGGCND